MLTAIQRLKYDSASPAAKNRVHLYFLSLLWIAVCLIHLYLKRKLSFALSLYWFSTKTVPKSWYLHSKRQPEAWWPGSPSRLKVCPFPASSGTEESNRDIGLPGWMTRCPFTAGNIQDKWAFMLLPIAIALFLVCEYAKPINSTIQKLIHGYRQQMLRHAPLPWNLFICHQR